MRHEDTKEDENLVIWKMNSTQTFFFSNFISSVQILVLTSQLSEV